MSQWTGVLRRPLQLLRKLAGKGLRTLRLRPQSRPWTPGLPSGLSETLLREACPPLHGEVFVQTEYLHLSPFKGSGGAARILVKLRGEREWTVCYKQCRYGPHEAPALVDHPVTLGPPEYAVYSRADVALRSLLPSVYFFEKSEPERSYRYLLEDLRGRYLKPTRPRDFLAAAGMLQKIEEAVGAWARDSGEAALIRYDHPLMLELGDYAERTLLAFADEHPTGLGVTRPEVAAMVGVMTRAEFHQYDEPSGVHGDCNPASLLIDTVEEGKLKVIDWEWAGIGIPHLDLAMLLESVDESTIQRALECYAKQRPRLSLAAHTRLYHWSRMTTCILNGAVLAAEIVRNAPAPRADRSAFLRRFLQLANAAHRQL